MVLALLVSLTALGASPSPPRCAGPPAAPAASRAAPAAVPSVANLYSARARRRIASYLRLRLLEMRAEGLKRAAAAVERRLPVDTLLAP